MAAPPARYKVRRDLQYRALGGKLERFSPGDEGEEIPLSQLDPEQTRGLRDAELVVRAKGSEAKVIALKLGDKVRYVTLGDHVEADPIPVPPPPPKRNRFL